MKKLRYLFVILMGAGLFTMQSCNQGEKKEERTKVPDLIQKAFQTKFPTATGVDWGMEDTTTYEAEFTLDSLKMSANFDNAGTWKETEWKIDKQELPDTVLMVLNSQFEGYDVDMVEVSETPEQGKVFELKLEKGEISLEVVIDETGTVFSKGEAQNEEAGEVKEEHQEEGEEK